MSVMTSQLVQETFDFWFKGGGHIRSPFPDYIRPDLERKSKERFHLWISNLKDSSKDEMNEEMIGEKLEEVIFDIASDLVKTEDERITILYPFLPRCGDPLINSSSEEGAIVDRSIVQEQDKRLLKVKVGMKDGQVWETSFELPL